MLKWSLLTAAIAVSLIVACCMALQSPVYHYPFHTTGPFSEADALRLSSRALDDAGLATPAMAPLPYRYESNFREQDKNRFFARNTITPDNGYVMWSVRYTVHLKRGDDEVQCTVSKNK